MPRANRFFLPGYIYHITHRCHKKDFLLKLRKDRKNWIRWLFESKKQYGLIVYNYMVTSNHIHLLVQSNKDFNTIPLSMKLIAGSTSKGYNIRKKRTGSFWEDRYHATAVQSEEYLIRCMIYLDMNMVRAGVVSHPSQWRECGFQEILKPKERYGIINHEKLLKSLSLSSMDDLKLKYSRWLDDTIMNDSLKRDERWAKSIAFGDQNFIENFKEKLGVEGRTRKPIYNDDGCYLEEPVACYVVSENLFIWNKVV
jgi:putative transposase